MTRKTKQKLIEAAVIAAFIAACLAFWEVIEAYMWACASAGIIM